MLFSLLSRYVSVNPEGKWMRATTWMVRVLTGAVFLFSGFAKAIDPWGTLYKTEDYLAALGLSLWPNLVVVGVFFLCGIEFLTGVFLITGCFRKGTARGCLLLMCFMLVLSLWIAVSDPVDDCGCFGDAFKISNWATFWKNIALTAASVWLVLFNRYCRCLVTPALQWVAFVATAVFIVLIELIGFLYQPLIDFRPYPIGATIAEETSTEEPEFVFIYRKNDKEKEFCVDSLPDESEGWEFVDRRQTVLPSATGIESGGFHIWNEDEDVTENVLTPDRDRLLLLMPDMGEVTIATTWKINSMRDWAEKRGIDMIAAVAGTSQEIDNWKDLSMPEYPIYTADDTAIKELARGNPAVVFTSGGKVVWKSSLKAIDVEDFMASGTTSDPRDLAPDNAAVLRNISYLYLSVMALLVMASLFTTIHGGRARRGVSSSHDTPAR